MRNSRLHTPALLLALTLAAACGGGEAGSMEDLEKAATESELAPDTAVPGPGMGMGAGSVQDTLSAGSDSAPPAP